MKSKGQFLALCFLLLLLCLSDAYDPMDPNGNITIKWDINSIEDATYNSHYHFCSSCCRNGQQPDLLQLPNGDDEGTSPFVLCTRHMCPIRVHWHLKVSYKEYWRVKVTVTNFNILKNYTDWNLVIQHPNLRSITQVFSFNYNPLIQYGDINDTGMFWGIKNYNDMLLQYGESGNVQTEMLLHKDPGDFTFKGGWALPRKIVFNGRECVMPPPDTYPSLPNSSPAAPALVRHGLTPFVLFVLFVFV
ncbi:hypothetical protein COCNU_scaffold048262G000010 [Cocos nucifera]|nr:hypothetical protein [Cocos nucifera]